MQNISKHITYKEAIHSHTAKKLGIDNTPNLFHIFNLQMVAEFIFEPLRAHVGHPIMVSSMFRSLDLNSALGGSKTSQHLYEGNAGAIDLDDTYGFMSNKEMLEWIDANLDYDQLISEKPDQFGNPSWVHVSYNMDGNRNQRFIID